MKKTITKKIIIKTKKTTIPDKKNDTEKMIVNCINQNIKKQH